MDNKGIDLQSTLTWGKEHTNDNAAPACLTGASLTWAGFMVKFDRGPPSLLAGVQPTD